MNPTAADIDTIAAIATPAGRGALAVIRLSGSEAAGIAGKCLHHEDSLPARRPVLRDVQTGGSTLIDRALVTFFPGPDSYTGEDVVEISCHGGRVVPELVLEACLEAGARLAEPGEFTLRAFLNGRMDLSQAEAVQDLIESQTRHQARVAVRQLDGELSRTLQPWKEELVTIISHLETTVEFVEDDVSPEDRQRLADRLKRVRHEVRSLLETFRAGRLLREGAQIVISGCPNTGKSSLFNKLGGSHRAIVSTFPGTTRDALRETISLGGIPVTLIDSAGVRESDDPVEQLGVERSIQSLAEADLILFVVDASRDLNQEDRSLHQTIADRPHLIVENKRDIAPKKMALPRPWVQKSRAHARVSALTGEGLEGLEKEVVAVLGGEQELGQDTAILTKLRHQRLLEEAESRLEAAGRALEQGESEEFVLYDLRNGLQAIGRITGEVTVEDLLDSIFSSFCIGK